MADYPAKAVNQRRVMVLGASGQIGVFAIPRLLNAGFDVVAVSRQPQPSYLPQSPHLRWLSFKEALQAQTNADQPNTGPAKAGQSGMDQQNQACSYLLSAGPMSLAIQAMRASNTFKQAVIFSSSSVLSKRDSADPAEKQLISSMRSCEQELEALVRQHNKRVGSNALNMVIFRPTLIYGCGLDANISRLAGLINRFGLMPVNGKGSGLRQPVHADDLARVAVSTLTYKLDLPAKLLLTGGSTISYYDMVKAIFKGLKKPVRIIRVPQWLLLTAISILKPLGLAGGVSVAMVKRQLQDLEFDNSQAQQLLGFQPRPFAPGKKDFEIPGSNNDKAD